MVASWSRARFGFKSVVVAIDALVVCVVDSPGDRTSVCLRTGFLSASIAALFGRRTTGITEHERLTQRKSKRPIECFVCMPWFCEICCVNVFLVAPYRTNISPSRVWSKGLVDLAFVPLRRTIFRRRRHWRTRYKAVRSIGLSMRFRISHRPVENAKTVPWESNVAKKPRARKMRTRNLLMRTRTNPIDQLCALEEWRHMQFR